jgi:ABC-type uncharacterized transport system permease subunit
MALHPFEAAVLAAAVLGYLLALGAAAADVAAVRRKMPPGRRLRRILLAGAFLAHAVLLGARAWRLGDAAFQTVSNLLLFVPWCLVFVASIIDARQDLKAMPVFLVPPVVIALLAAAFLLRSPEGATVPIPEAGRSAIRIHVASITLSFGSFAFAAVLSAMYLFLEVQLRKKRFDHWLELPALDRLERIGGRFLVAGFALLTVSIVLGAAHQAVTRTLGPSWFLSPLIVGAWVTWVAAAAVALLRHRALLFGRRLAQATLVVFALVLMTLAAPLLVGGDHAPASFVEKE